MTNITINKIVLVKETSHRYDIPKSIGSPQDAFEAIEKVCHLSQEAQEVAVALYVNNSNRIVGIHEISRGTINYSIVNPREVFKAALLHNASAVILAHNHPSEHPNPSSEDIKLTTRMADAGKIMDIRLLDHLIIYGDSFTSMKKDRYF